MSDGSDTGYLDYVHGRLTALRRVALMLCGDEYQADDLVQETITKLYANWPRISRADNVDGYVHRMLVHAFLDERRRGWWRVRLLGEPPERPDPVQEREDRAIVRTALKKVPPKQQAVLVLRFLCDLPVGEVAAILGVSDGTVKSQTSHGLTALRRVLGDRVGGPIR